MHRGRIKITSIDLLFLILINTVFSYFTTSVYTLIRYFLTMYLFVKYYKELHKSVVLYLLLMTYSVLLGLSSYLNNNSITWGLSGFMHGLRLMCIFSVVSGVHRRRGMDEVVSTLLLIVSILIIPTDLLIFFYPYEFSSTTVYLIGNKFYVSYMHSVLLVLLSIKWMNCKKWQLVMIYLFCIFITIRIRCTTGILMILVCLLGQLILFAFSKLTKAVCHIGLVAVSLAVINMLIWGASAILYTPWATHFIVDVLGKSANMTGRFKLYSVIPELVKNESIIGYGFQPDIFRNLFGYGNAQNGLIQIVLESGILGATIYFVALYYAGKQGNKNVMLYPVYLYLLCFTVGSISEINLSNFFVFGIALLYSFGISNRRKDESIKE